jgi:hypothetical protein
LATTNTKLRSQQWGSLYFLTSLSKKKKKNNKCIYYRYRY